MFVFDWGTRHTAAEAKHASIVYAREEDRISYINPQQQQLVENEEQHQPENNNNASK